MLRQYGNTLTVIDATYNTTCYQLPLLCLCVPTNVGYFNVASMLLSNEKTESVKLAIERVKVLNPEWRPSCFMTDFSEPQIAAMEAVFPGMMTTIMVHPSRWCVYTLACTCLSRRNC